MSGERVAVIGAGGIGGFVAGALARAGVDVGIVARGAHLSAIRNHGLTVRSAALGDFTVQPFASDDPADLNGASIVFLAFKAHQWPPLLNRLASFGRSGATIVTLQNGVPFWFAPEPPLQSVDPGGRIAAAFEQEQTVGAVVHSSGMLLAPGVVQQSGRVLYPLGDAAGGIARAQSVVSLLRTAGLDGQPEPDIRRRVWSKLVNNASLNPLSAERGWTVHRLLADDSAMMQLRALMAETIAVGRALGVAEDLTVEDQLAVASHIADVKTSMLQDRDAGRSLELQPIVGAVIELADRLGIGVPNLRRMYGALSSSAAHT